MNDSQQQGRYEKIFAEDVVVSTYGKGILSKTLMGLKACRSKYVFVASADMPLIEKSVVENLYKNLEYEDFSAVVPRHESGKIEPMHSIYNVKETIPAIQDNLADERFRFENVIQTLENVKYVPASGFHQSTFNRVLSNIDFEKVRNSLEKKVYKARIEKAERLSENIKRFDTPNAVYFKVPGTKEQHEVRYIKRTKKWVCDCRYFCNRGVWCNDNPIRYRWIFSSSGVRANRSAWTYQSKAPR